MRGKLMNALQFLRSKGFSEDMIFESMNRDGFGPKPSPRDENGLPVLEKDVGSSKKANPFVDKMKQKAPSGDEHEVNDLPKPGVAADSAGKIFDQMPVKTSQVKESSSGVSVTSKSDLPEKPKSWAEMLSKSPSVDIAFDYFPMKSGTGVVSPPLEVLKKGNDKLKFSIIGTFSKGYLPFKKVADFAMNSWKKYGLQHVSQKEERTFVFRFGDNGGMNSVLSVGTWYIEKRPLLVHAWGSTPGNITHMPLWVRFDKVPDSYWTREGLSCLGSAIGKPLSADELTKKLEIIPFAKLCVDYTIGDALPTKLQVEVLEPHSDKVALHEVLVSYPNMPTVCSGCRSLGHLIGACPRTSRIWVAKKIAPVNCSAPPEPPVGINDAHVEAAPETTQNAPLQKPDSPLLAATTPVEQWHTVSRKHKLHPSDSSPSPSADDTTPPPPNTFRNLTMVDEIDAKHRAPISKSQRKKLRRAAKSSGGSPAPHQ